MSKPKLALIPSGYKSGKVYSILPNDATGDFDFTRQSIGTRVRKDGLIEEAKTSGSITNLILNSEDFSTNWTNFNGASISTDQALAPDGTNTADKIVSNGTNYSFTRPTSNITVTNAKYYTASIYVKADVETVGYIRCDYGTLIYNRKFDLTAGTLSTGFDNTANIPENERIEELANGWYRVSITDVVDTISFEMRIYCADGSASSGDSLFLWGAMVSEGALSDYIKTEGSQVTKRVETFTDVPRLDWLNSNCPSLLLEPQRTNLQVYSEQFDNSAWSKANSTIEANSIISPNGELSADKLIANTVNTSHYVQGTVSGLSTSTEATFSVFVKKSEISQLQLLCAQNSSPFTNWGRLQFDLNTLTEFSTNIGTFGYEDYGNGWLRVFVTGTPTSTGALIRVTLYKNFSNAFVGNDSDGFYLFGAQVEQGSYPTSYIKTEASTVTRLKDECLNGGDSDLFNVSELSLLIDATNFATPLNNFCYISLTDGQSSPINMIRLTYEETRILITVYDNGTFEMGYNITSVTANQRNKVLLTFNGNEAKIYFNGVLKNTSNGVPLPSNLDSLSFSNRTEDGRNFEGKVHDVRVYDRVLTEAEAIEITTL